VAFIARLPVTNKWLKLLAFGLVALNPALIAINSQATNDTFAILFSTLAIYCAYVFLQNKKLTPFLLAILFTALGIASKTNVWVTAMVIVITLFIQVFSQPGRMMKSAVHAIAFLITVPVLSVINPLTQYVANYETYGKPVLMNIGTLPLPPLTGISKYNDRGVSSPSGMVSLPSNSPTFSNIPGLNMTMIIIPQSHLILDYALRKRQFSQFFQLSPILVHHRDTRLLVDPGNFLPGDPAYALALDGWIIGDIRLAKGHFQTK